MTMVAATSGDVVAVLADESTGLAAAILYRDYIPTPSPHYPSLWSLCGVCRV